MNPAKFRIVILERLKARGNENARCERAGLGWNVVIYFHELEGGPDTLSCALKIDSRPINRRGEIFAGRRCDVDGFIRVRPRRSKRSIGRSAESEWGGGYAYAFRGRGCFFVSRLKRAGDEELELS